MALLIALAVVSFVGRDVGASEPGSPLSIRGFGVAIAADVEVALQKSLLAATRENATPELPPLSAFAAPEPDVVAQPAPAEPEPPVPAEPEPPAPAEPDELGRGEYLGRFKVTCYALQGITFSGAPVALDGIATDPAVIPMGDRVYVDGLGWKVARDTGRLIVDQTIDIWNPSYDWCIQWGVQYLDVWAAAG